MEYAFVPSTISVYSLCKVITVDASESMVELEMLDNEKNDEKSSSSSSTIIKVKREELIPVSDVDLHHLQSQATDDLTHLINVNRASILHILRKRYEQECIYTSIGSILVAINPFQNISGLYTNETMGSHQSGELNLSNSPHVYAIAANAKNGLSLGINQSIIVSGESGSGKTESMKHCMNFLTNTSTSNADQTNAQFAHVPILEAMGNAKTLRNNNSSRFGKYTEILFSGNNSSIVGSNLSTYLLEKTRVVSQEMDERNYHIFYFLLNGGNQDMLKQLDLIEFQQNPALCYYLGQSGCVKVESIDDTESFTELENAFRDLYFNNNEKTDLYTILAGVLHMGNIAAVNDPINEGECIIPNANKTHIERCAKAWGLEAFGAMDSLESVLLKRSVRRGGKNASIAFRKYTDMESAQARDAIAKEVYKRSFDWVVNRINELIKTQHFAGDMKENDEGRLSIGMLDIFGFEICAKNSFEQLCINLCNEVMQMHFNKSIFDLEMELYKNENIPLPPLTYNNNADVIDLLRNKSNGCFTLLDDEINVPGGSFNGYMNKLDSQHRNNVRFKSMKKGKDIGFIITHYAGQVNYDPSLFLEKNKDTLPADAVELLQGSSMALIRDLFSEAPEKSKASNKKSVSKIFLQQLDDLVLALSQTKSHFIRCIKPNPEKTPFTFDALSVDDQLRNSGVFETVLVMKNGYSFRLEHSLFMQRYHLLMLSENIEHQMAWKALTSDSSKNNRQKCESFLDVMVANDMPGGTSVTECKVGTTLVFFRPKQYYELDKLRTEKVHTSACLLQKVAVTYMTRLLIRGIRERIRVCEASFLNTEFDSLHISSSHVRSYLERLQRFPATLLAVAVVASAVEVLKISDQFLIVYDKVKQLGSEVTKILPLFSSALENKASFQEKMEGLQTLFNLFSDMDDMNFRGVYKETVVEYEWSQFPILQEAHMFVTKYDEQYTLYNSFVEAQKGNDLSTMQECMNSLEILRSNMTIDNMFLQPFVDIESKVSKILQPLKEERDALIQQCLASLQLSDGEISVNGNDAAEDSSFRLKNAKHIQALVSELKFRKTVNKNIHVVDIIKCFEKVLTLREMAASSQWSSMAVQLSEWRDILSLKKDKRRRRSSLSAPSRGRKSSSSNISGDINNNSFTVPFELEDALNKELQVLNKCTALQVIKPKLKTAIASSYIPADYFMSIQEKESNSNNESQGVILSIDSLEIVMQEAEEYRSSFDETCLILYMTGHEHLNLLRSVQSIDVSSIEQCLRQSTMIERSHKDFIQAEIVVRSLEIVCEMHAIVNMCHHSGDAGTYKCTVTSYYLARFKQCIINAQNLSISNEKWQLLMIQFEQLHDMYTYLLNEKDNLAIDVVNKFFDSILQSDKEDTLRGKQENKMSNREQFESLTKDAEKRAVVADVCTLIGDHFTTWKQELTHRQAVSEMLGEISRSSTLASHSNSTLSTVDAMDALYNKYAAKFISGDSSDKIKRDMRYLAKVRASYVSQDTTRTAHVHHNWGKPGINPDNTLKKFSTPQPDNEYSLAASNNEVEKLTGLSKSALNAVDVHQNTLLIWAADKGALSTVEFLLQSDNSNVNHRGYLGNTALARAARGGHVECVEALLKCDNIDCNIANDKQQFPLHFAAFKRKSRCVQIMIDSGKCDYTVKDRKGRIPAQDTSDESIRNNLLKARSTQIAQERANMKDSDDIPVDMNPILRSEYELVLHKVVDQKTIAALNEVISLGSITSVHNCMVQKEHISVDELAESIQFYEKYPKVSFETKFLLLNAKMIYYLRQCVLLDRWEEEKRVISSTHGDTDAINATDSTSESAFDMDLDLSFLNLSIDELMKHLQNNANNRHSSLVTAKGDVLPLRVEDMNKNLAIFAYLEETSDLSRLSISDTTVMNLLNSDLLVLDSSPSTTEEEEEGGRREEQKQTLNNDAVDLSTLTVSRLLRIFSSTGIHPMVAQEVAAVRSLSIDRRARLLLHHAALDGNLHGTMDKGLEIENVRTSLLIHALAFVDKYSDYCTSEVVQNWTENAQFLLNMRINLLTLSDTYSEHTNENLSATSTTISSNDNSKTKIVSTRRLSQFLPRLEHLAEKEVSIFDTLIRTSFQVNDFETILNNIVDGFPSYEIIFVRNTLQNLLSIDSILMSLSIGRPVVMGGRFDVSSIKYEHLSSLLEHYASTNTDTTDGTSVDNIEPSTDNSAILTSITPVVANVSQKVALLLTYAQLIMNIRQAIHLRLTSEESMALETLHTSLVNLENKMEDDKAKGLGDILPAVVTEEYTVVELDYRRQVIMCEFRQQFASHTVHGLPLSLTLSHVEHTALEQQQSQVDALDLEGKDDELQQIKAAAAQMVRLRQTAQSVQSNYNRDNSLTLTAMSVEDTSLRNVTSRIVESGYLEDAISSALRCISSLSDDVNQLRSTSNNDDRDDNANVNTDITMDLDKVDSLALQTKKEWAPIILCLDDCLHASECSMSKNELDVLLEETRHRSYMDVVVKYLVVLDSIDNALQGRYDTESHKMQAAVVINRLSSTLKSAHKSIDSTRISTSSSRESLFTYLRKSAVIAIHLYRGLLSSTYDEIHRDWRQDDINFTVTPRFSSLLNDDYNGDHSVQQILRSISEVSGSIHPLVAKKVRLITTELEDEISYQELSHACTSTIITGDVNQLILDKVSTQGLDIAFDRIVSEHAINNSKVLQLYQSCQLLRSLRHILIHDKDRKQGANNSDDDKHEYCMSRFAIRQCYLVMLDYFDIHLTGVTTIDTALSDYQCFEAVIKRVYSHNYEVHPLCSVEINLLFLHILDQQWQDYSKQALLYGRVKGQRGALQVGTTVGWMHLDKLIALQSLLLDHSRRSKELLVIISLTRQMRGDLLCFETETNNWSTSLSLTASDKEAGSLNARATNIVSSIIQQSSDSAYRYYAVNVIHVGVDSLDKTYAVAAQRHGAILKYFSLLQDDDDIVTARRLRREGKIIRAHCLFAIGRTKLFRALDIPVLHSSSKGLEGKYDLGHLLAQAVSFAEAQQWSSDNSSVEGKAVQLLDIANAVLCLYDDMDTALNLPYQRSDIKGVQRALELISEYYRQVCDSDAWYTACFPAALRSIREALERYIEENSHIVNLRVMSQTYIDLLNSSTGNDTDESVDKEAVHLQNLNEIEGIAVQSGYGIALLKTVLLLWKLYSAYRVREWENCLPYIDLVKYSSSQLQDQDALVVKGCYEQYCKATMVTMRLTEGLRRVILPPVIGWTSLPTSQTFAMMIIDQYVRDAILMYNEYTQLYNTSMNATNSNSALMTVQSGLRGVYDVAAVVVRLIKAIRCNRLISAGADKDIQTQEYMATIALNEDYAAIYTTTLHLDADKEEEGEGEGEGERETVLDLCLLLQNALQSPLLTASTELSMIYWYQVILLSARRECLYAILCEEVHITMAEFAVEGKIGELVVNQDYITALQRLEKLFKDKDLSHLAYNSDVKEKFERLCQNSIDYEGDSKDSNGGSALHSDFCALCSDNIMLISAQQSISLLLRGFTALSERDIGTLRAVIDEYLPRHYSNGMDYYYTLMYTQCVDAIEIMSRPEYTCETAEAYPVNILGVAHPESNRSTDMIAINDDGSGEGDTQAAAKIEDQMGGTDRRYCLWEQSHALLHAIHQEYLFEQTYATFTSLVTESQSGVLEGVNGNLSPLDSIKHIEPLQQCYNVLSSILRKDKEENVATFNDQGTLLLQSLHVLIQIRLCRLHHHWAEMEHFLQTAHSYINNETLYFSTQDKDTNNTFNRPFLSLYTTEIELMHAEVAQQNLIYHLQLAIDSKGLPYGRYESFDPFAVDVATPGVALKRATESPPKCEQAIKMHRSVEVIVKVRELAIAEQWLELRQYLRDIDANIHAKDDNVETLSPPPDNGSISSANAFSLDNVYHATCIQELYAAKHFSYVMYALSRVSHAYDSNMRLKGHFGIDISIEQCAVGSAAAGEAVAALQQIEESIRTHSLHVHLNTCTILKEMRHAASLQEWHKVYDITLLALDSERVQAVQQISVLIIDEIRTAHQHSKFIVSKALLSHALKHNQMSGQTGSVNYSTLSLKVLQAALSITESIDCDHEVIKKLQSAVRYIYRLRAAQWRRKWMNSDNGSAGVSSNTDVRYEDPLRLRSMEPEEAIECLIHQYVRKPLYRQHLANTLPPSASNTGTNDDSKTLEDIDGDDHEENGDRILSETAQCLEIAHTVGEDTLDPVECMVSGWIIDNATAIDSEIALLSSNNDSDTVESILNSLRDVSGRDEIPLSTLLNWPPGASLFVHDVDDGLATECMAEIRTAATELLYREVVVLLLYAIRTPGPGGWAGALDVSECATSLLERSLHFVEGNAVQVLHIGSVRWLLRDCNLLFTMRSQMCTLPHPDWAGLHNLTTFTDEQNNDDYIDTEDGVKGRKILFPVYREYLLMKADCMFYFYLSQFSREVEKSFHVTQNLGISMSYGNTKDSIDNETDDEGCLSDADDESEDGEIRDKTSLLHLLTSIKTTMLSNTSNHIDNLEYSKLVEAIEIALELKVFRQYNYNQIPIEISAKIDAIKNNERLQNKIMGTTDTSYVSLLVPELHHYTLYITKEQYSNSLVREISKGQGYLLTNVGEIEATAISVLTLQEVYDTAVMPLSRSGNPRDRSLLRVAHILLCIRQGIKGNDWATVRTLLKDSLTERDVIHNDTLHHLDIQSEVARLHVELDNFDAISALTTAMHTGRLVDIMKVAKSYHAQNADISSQLPSDFIAGLKLLRKSITLAKAISLKSHILMHTLALAERLNEIRKAIDTGFWTDATALLQDEIITALENNENSDISVIEEFRAIRSALTYRSYAIDVAKHIIKGKVSGTAGQVRYPDIGFIELFFALENASHLAEATASINEKHTITTMSGNDPGNGDDGHITDHDHIDDNVEEEDKGMNISIASLIFKMGRHICDLRIAILDDNWVTVPGQASMLTGVTGVSDTTVTGDMNSHSAHGDTGSDNDGEDLISYMDTPTDIPFPESKENKERELSIIVNNSEDSKRASWSTHQHSRKYLNVHLKQQQVTCVADILQSLREEYTKAVASKRREADANASSATYKDNTVETVLAGYVPTPISGFYNLDTKWSDMDDNELTIAYNKEGFALLLDVDKTSRSDKVKLLQKKYRLTKRMRDQLPIVSVHEGERGFHDQLHTIYNMYAPDKIHKIDDIITKFKGKETYLLEQLANKYKMSKSDYHLLGHKEMYDDINIMNRGDFRDMSKLDDWLEISNDDKVLLSKALQQLSGEVTSESVERLDDFDLQRHWHVQILLAIHSFVEEITLIEAELEEKKVKNRILLGLSAVKEAAEDTSTETTATLVATNQKDDGYSTRLASYDTIALEATLLDIASEHSLTDMSDVHARFSVELSKIFETARLILMFRKTYAMMEGDNSDGDIKDIKDNRNGTRAKQGDGDGESKDIEMDTTAEDDGNSTRNATLARSFLGYTDVQSLSPSKLNELFEDARTKRAQGLLSVQCGLDELNFYLSLGNKINMTKREMVRALSQGKIRGPLDNLDILGVEIDVLEEWYKNGCDLLDSNPHNDLVEVSLRNLLEQVNIILLLRRAVKGVLDNSLNSGYDEDDRSAYPGGDSLLDHIHEVQSVFGTAFDTISFESTLAINWSPVQMVVEKANKLNIRDSDLHATFKLEIDHIRAVLRLHDAVSTMFHILRESSVSDDNLATSYAILIPRVIPLRRVILELDAVLSYESELLVTEQDLMEDKEVHLLSVRSSGLSVLRDTGNCLVQLYCCIINNEWGLEKIIESNPVDLIRLHPTDIMWSRFLHNCEMQRVSSNLVDIHDDIINLARLRSNASKSNDGDIDTNDNSNTGSKSGRSNIRSSIMSLAFFTPTESWEEKVGDTQNMLQGNSRRISMTSRRASMGIDDASTSNASNGNRRGSVRRGSMNMTEEASKRSRRESLRQSFAQNKTKVAGRRKSVVTSSDALSGRSVTSGGKGAIGKYIAQLNKKESKSSTEALTSDTTVAELLSSTNWSHFPTSAKAYFNKARDSFINLYLQFAMKTACLDDEYTTQYGSMFAGELLIREDCCEHLKLCLKEIRQLEYYYTISYSMNTSNEDEGLIISQQNQNLESEHTWNLATLQWRYVTEILSRLRQEVMFGSEYNHDVLERLEFELSALQDRELDHLIIEEYTTLQQVYHEFRGEYLVLQAVTQVYHEVMSMKKASKTKGLFNTSSQRNREEESKMYRTMMSHPVVQKLMVLDKASRPHMMSTSHSSEYYFALENLASIVQSSLVEASLFQLNSLSIFLDEIKEMQKSQVLFRTNETVWIHLIEMFEYFIERTCTVNNQTRERRVSFTLQSMHKQGSSKAANNISSGNNGSNGKTGDMSLLFGATDDGRDMVREDKQQRTMQVIVMKIIYGISLLSKTRSTSHNAAIAMLTTVYEKHGNDRDFISRHLEWMIVLRVILELFGNEEVENRNAGHERWNTFFDTIDQITAVGYYLRNIMDTQHSLEDLSTFAPFEMEKLMEVPAHGIIAIMIKDDAVDVVKKDIYHVLKEMWSIISPQSEQNFKSIMAKKDSWENEIERDLDDEDVEQFSNKILLRYLGQFIV